MNPELSRRLQRFGHTVDAAAEAEEVRRASVPATHAAAVAELDTAVPIRRHQHRFYRALAVAAAAAALVAGGVVFAIGRSTTPTESGRQPVDQTQAAAVTQPSAATRSTAASAPDTTARPSTTAATTSVATSALPRRGGPPPECPSYTPTDDYHLDICDSGTAVRLAQERLKATVDSSLTVDGYFGPATRAAVRTFQQRHGLTIDGQIGPATWRLLVPNAPGADADGNGVVDPNEIGMAEGSVSMATA
jgi:murein L,D-transpeptidase YcbB/YkuD